MKLLDAEAIDCVVGGTWMEPGDAQAMIDEFNRNNPKGPYEVPEGTYWP